MSNRSEINVMSGLSIMGQLLNNITPNALNWSIRLIRFYCVFQNMLVKQIDFNVLAKKLVFLTTLMLGV